MKKVNIQQLADITNDLSNFYGYLTDNSCSDPDCCGGPFYTHEDYEKGIFILKQLGLEYAPT